MSQILLQEIKNLVQQERRITRSILEKINEVDHRRLYATWGYPNLYEWLVKDLGYSHSAAYRRMQAARLLKSVPVVSEKMQSGGVNLSTLAKVQTAIRLEERRRGGKISSETKQELVQKIENKSAQETDFLLAEIFPEQKPRQEHMRALPDQEVRLSITLNSEQLGKLQKVRELSSHTHLNTTWSELIEMLSDQFLNKKDPVRMNQREQNKARSSSNPIKIQAFQHLVQKNQDPQKPSDHQISQGSQSLPGSQKSQYPRKNQIDQTAQDSESSSNVPARSPSQPLNASLTQRLSDADRKRVRPASFKTSFKTKPRPEPKAIPSALRRKIWLRDDGACTYTYPQTGQRCGSRILVEIDHLEPKAFGGRHTADNLRCLCRTHNHLAAEQKLGRNLMDFYRRSFSFKEVQPS
ncbi:MAG: HNH endonuclease [Bdellovibrionaceae bacterium]|nr:HNH endonuclease [Pseudobdellovibrionaceae bacterium]